ncbi:MAG: hypothetical protein E4G96_06685 [Chrysiogenales bacterium]|nr:MAG: hypothetical protein E4G96_06685 [Chrysiogenales bacterium]
MGMAKKLILHGRVQGVFCRAFCAHYARKHRIRGTASNLSDGTVRVLLDTNDPDLTGRYVCDIRSNPEGYAFYGRIDSVNVENHDGPLTGEYSF